MVFLISLHWTEQFYLLSTELRQNRADLPKTEWMKARLAFTSKVSLPRVPGE